MKIQITVLLTASLLVAGCSATGTTESAPPAVQSPLAESPLVTPSTQQTATATPAVPKPSPAPSRTMLAMPASRQPAVPDAQTCQATKVAILPLSKGKAGYKEASQNLQAAADSASDELQGAIGILAGYYDEMAKDNPDQAMLNQVEQSVPWKNANDTLYRICGTSEIHQ